VLEFFCLTPLPGSEDHQVLWKAGVTMEPDLNKYDVEHVCAPHANMSRVEWEAIYQEAWQLYYTPEHMKILLRRAVATDVPVGSLIKVLASFASSVRLEGVHPLQSGIFRMKHPSERRDGLRRESPWVFWPGFVVGSLGKQIRFAATIMRLFLMSRAIRRDPAAHSYMDQALTPVQEDEASTLDLFTKTTGGRAAIKTPVSAAPSVD
jgi:hypothetical protein